VQACKICQTEEGQRVEVKTREGKTYGAISLCVECLNLLNGLGLNETRLEPVEGSAPAGLEAHFKCSTDRAP
jgi:hypothetical protein